MSKNEQTFEQSISRLEKIVESIEQGKIGLEESIKHFEEGMTLIERRNGMEFFRDFST